MQGLTPQQKYQLAAWGVPWWRRNEVEEYRAGTKVRHMDMEEGEATVTRR